PLPHLLSLLTVITPSTHPLHFFFFFLIIPLPPRSTLFPYTTLFRSEEATNLKNNYSEQINIVKQYYQNKGVSLQTANLIAKQLMEKEDRVATLVNIKHGINMGQYLNPWMAAWSSMFSAALGGLFPLVAMTYAPSNSRWLATILAVIISVGLTGMISAKLGKSNIKYAVLRNIVVGIITMAIHYYVGQLI